MPPPVWMLGSEEREALTDPQKQRAKELCLSVFAGPTSFSVDYSVTPADVFMEWSVEDIAQQLTLIDFEVYRKIEARGLTMAHSGLCIRHVPLRWVGRVFLRGVTNACSLKSLLCKRGVSLRRNFAHRTLAH